MLDPNSLAILASFSALSIPLIYLALAVWPGGRGARAWAVSLAAMGLAFFAALLTTLMFVLHPGSTELIRSLPIKAVSPGLWPSLGIDTLTVAMLLLITFIGGVILHFSRHYLAGDPAGVDPGQGHFRRWFAATLACVTTLVITNQLVLLALGWIGTSLCLHQLLTYYPDRPKALLAAHKKFLISRLADLCLVAAVLILGHAAQSFQIDQVMQLPAQTITQTPVTVATLLLATAALLKCAQLPFHGWLIQVMEAPTPVSALLHAGIVNIGGFLMIRLAPLMAASEPAQMVLVIVGCLTAVTAALVMETRVSIKVMLAWSTCAQMGFMLLECGLGLYHLAMLHLLAHSLYKAHSFLSSGQAVQIAHQRAQSPKPTRFGPASLWMGAVTLLIAALGLKFFPGPRNLALDTVLIVALISLIIEPAATRVPGRMLLTGAGIVVLYLTASLVFSDLIKPLPQVVPAWINLGIIALFILLATTVWLGRQPHSGRLIRWLYPHLYGGFYLDELFTRLTLFLWPPRITAAGSGKAPTPQPQQPEIQS